MYDTINKAEKEKGEEKVEFMSGISLIIKSRSHFLEIPYGIKNKPKSVE